jgi:hypothetical protein
VASRGWALFVLLVAAPLVGVAIISNLEFRPAPGFLEVEMRATGGTAAQLFWTSTWAFSQAESSVVPLHTRPNEFRARPLSPFRTGRSSSCASTRWTAPATHSSAGCACSTPPAGRSRRSTIVMSPAYQIASITPEGEDVRVVTAFGANDPMLCLPAAAGPSALEQLAFHSHGRSRGSGRRLHALAARRRGPRLRELRPIDVRHSLWPRPSCSRSWAPS